VARVLVVDDSKLDRTLVEQILQADSSLTIDLVENADEALAQVERAMPDVIVTDLVMPGASGLDLVRSLTVAHPSIPVILMTSQGSEEIAMDALRVGAASYFPKSGFGPELLNVVIEVMELSKERRRQAELYGALVHKECTFEVETKLSLVRPLVKLLQRSLDQIGWCDETACTQAGVALSEAIQNGMEHGNLEVSSAAREDGMKRYHALLEERRQTEPYASRRLRVDATFGESEARFVIEDEGPGFDPASLPDPRDPANLEKVSGRGVLLMRTFMDEVEYSASGSTVILVKRRARS
jgi:CheY-like chemotaxis protein